MNQDKTQPNPLVSIIIPTYNRANIISKTIESALAQTYQNIEIIIVNDGGTDNTKEIVNQFSDTKIKYLEKPNGGLSSARNYGLKYANGKYLQFCDDDDTLLPEKTEKQVKSMMANKYSVSFCDGYFVYTSSDKNKTLLTPPSPPCQGGTRVSPLTGGARGGIAALECTVHKNEKKKIFEHQHPKNLIDYIFYGSVAPFHCFMFHKKCFENDLRFDETLPVCEDFDFLLKLAIITDFDFLPLQLVNCNKHTDNMSNDFNLIAKTRLKVIKNIVNSNQDKFPNEQKKQLNSIIYFNEGKIKFFNQKKTAAAKDFIKAIKNNRQHHKAWFFLLFCLLGYKIFNTAIPLYEKIFKRKDTVPRLPLDV